MLEHAKKETQQVGRCSPGGKSVWQKKRERDWKDENLVGLLHAHPGQNKPINTLSKRF
jgi:hypothetical protein